MLCLVFILYFIFENFLHPNCELLCAIHCLQYHYIPCTLLIPDVKHFPFMLILRHACSWSIHTFKPMHCSYNLQTTSYLHITLIFILWTYFYVALHYLLDGCLLTAKSWGSWHFPKTLLLIVIITGSLTGCISRNDYNAILVQLFPVAWVVFFFSYPTMQHQL